MAIYFAAVYVWCEYGMGDDASLIAVAIAAKFYEENSFQLEHLSSSEKIKIYNRFRYRYLKRMRSRSTQKIAKSLNKKL
jgi:hypothetical protein